MFGVGVGGSISECLRHLVRSHRAVERSVWRGALWRGGVVQCGPAWHGMAWRGVAWRGVATGREGTQRR